MKARDIMTANPSSCHPKDRLCSAINIMREHNVGVVPVTDGADGRHLVGIITDRDVALSLGAEEKACSQLNVESCMSRQVFFCYPDDDLKKVEQIMKEHKVRRVPVVDQEGTLQGIIATADIAREVLKEKREGRAEVPETDLAEILEAVSLSS
ncbi:MAG: CBS domain-containing protein [bacterium]|nr:CBS domain-containing protein [bacterium]